MLVEQPKLHGSLKFCIEIQVSTQTSESWMKHLFSMLVVFTWPVLLLFYWTLLEGKNSVFSRAPALRVEFVLFALSLLTVFVFAISTRSRKCTIGYALIVMLLYCMVVKTIERKVAFPQRGTIDQVDFLQEPGPLPGDASSNPRI